MADRGFALGDRGVLVPDGMTPEMVLAAAAILCEHLYDYIGHDIDHYGACALVRLMWVAMAEAQAKGSDGIALDHQ
jgi:hypothetical protein